MSDGDHAEFLGFATGLAKAAAELSLPRLGRSALARKPDNSVVTETDHRIQGRIVGEISRRFPDHAIIAEERLEPTRERPAPADAEYCWVIDPIDGTRNFVAGVPCFSTSIAVLRHGRPVVGVVYEHNIGRLYSAAAGRGARLDGEPIRVCAPDPDHDILVGIPSSKDAWSRKVIAAWVKDPELVVRNFGSTAVHLAMVASGGLAGAFCKKCKLWDVAAGVLLVGQAGGKVTDADGNDLDRFALEADHGRNIPTLAAEPTIHARLLPTIQEAAAAG